MNTYRISYTVRVSDGEGSPERLQRESDWIEADSEALALVQFGFVLVNFPHIVANLVAVAAVLETN